MKKKPIGGALKAKILAALRALECPFAFAADEEHVLAAYLSRRLRAGRKAK
jgi:hypothetical protein